MIIGTEFPVELFADGHCIGVQSSSVGEMLAQVADAPVGAWTAVLLDGIDPAGLSSWDLAVYVKVRGRVQAWASALLSDGVAELASRADVDRPDFEIALALAAIACHELGHATGLWHETQDVSCMFNGSAHTSASSDDFSQLEQHTY